ncbi:MAG: pyridoxal 5'-phosphate synthase glutaminase subunit PdxT [Polyangiaceae bacterium]|nr:pyridoxal 5'-phosphate synthase glutaminase subunit PdxT [Polyangiaceae bacterium]
MARIGILAVQGAFAPHAQVLRSLGHEPVLLRAPEHLEGPLAGMVFPGGESSVQIDLVARLGLEPGIRAVLDAGVPVLATCAGLILLARDVDADSAHRQWSFGAVDLAVVRNGWGRQVDSFEDASEQGRPLIFIRAPRIVRVGPAVEIVDRYRGEPVLVRAGAIMAATFHPELSEGDGLHREVFGAAAASASAAQ